MNQTAHLSPKQLESLSGSTARVNIWEGSVRSGKTIASLLRWLIYVATSDISGELVVVSRTRSSAARNVFAPLADPNLFGPAASQVHYTAGADTATVLGRTVWVLGSSDVRSENVLRGLTCSGAYVDEVTLLREDFFTQLLNRLWEGAKLFGTTNPDNPAHWLKKKFLDRLDVLPDWRRWKFVLDDNPALSEERKAAIRRENTGLFYRRNVLGEWVAAEGAIYDMWDPARHVVDPGQVPAMERVLAVGIDYGTTNPTRGLIVGLAQQALWVLDEWAPAGGTDAELSAAFIRWLDSRPEPVWRDPDWVFVDPAAASFKLQLYRDGLTNVANGANSVVPGIRTVGSLLALDRLKVSTSCPHLIDQLPGYSWDPKATERGEDKPLKVADHEADALRYAVHTSRTLWSNDISLHTVTDDDTLEEAA